MLNNVVMMGRLTADPELREVTGGKKVTTFCIAVDREFKNSEGKYDCDFFPVVFWEGKAETIANYFKKGQRILVTGRMQNRSYEKDGVKKTITELFGVGFNFIESGNKGGTQTKGETKNESFGKPVAENDDIPF